MGMRTRRMLFALLGILAVAAIAPQLALADAPITGQVTDAVSGNGISGVTITLYNASTGMSIFQSTTTTNGDYNLGTWPNGSYQLQFVDGGSRYGGVWYSGKPSQSQATPVTVSGSSAVSANQALQPDQVTGQLTDQLSGQPISGVEVELLSQAGANIAQTTTDSGGHYSFSAIAAGTYEVAFNPGQANHNYNSAFYGGASPTQFLVGAGQTTAGVDGRLITDGAVGGQLTDQATGQPISGIEVELLSGPSTKFAQATTDANGDYSFSSVPPGTYYAAFNPQGANSNFNSTYFGGSTPTGFKVADGQTTPNINGQLIDGGAIGGTVNSTAQGVIANLSVQVTNVSTGNTFSTTTGANGAYLIDGLPAGSYDVYFSPGSGQNYVYQYYPDKSNVAAAQAVSVTAGKTTSHIDASLATGATVSGQVTDAVTHAAVSGATVYVYTYAGGYPQHVYNNRATTDSGGSWSVSGLPTGSYEVGFYAPNGSNYGSQYYNDVTGQDPPTLVSLTAGTTTSPVNAALAPGGQINGTVTDGTSGKPAAGVAVVAFDEGGTQLSYGMTDANGHYTLSGLTTSTPYRVAFYPPSGSSLEAEFYKSGATLKTATPVAVTEGQTTPNIDETLGAGGTISGVVSDAATGYPIGSAQVLLADDAGDTVYADQYGTYTDTDGTYEFTNVPPGSYKVEFSSVGALAFQYYHDASTLSTATTVNVTAGQTTANVDGALAQGGSVAGRVTDAVSGQGVADAFVEVLDAGNHFRAEGETDPNGQYKVSGLAPGSYYLEVFPNSNGPQGNYPVEFYGGSGTLAGATPVTITAGATTSGIDVALAPPGSASVSSTSTQPTPVTTTTTTPTTTPQTGVTARVNPGPPTLAGGSLSGLGKGKPVVKFRLRSGANGAHKLHSFKVKLPAGLAFVPAQLRNGVKVTGGGKVTEKVAGGQLVVTLGSPAAAVTVSISMPALKVTPQLVAKVAGKRAGTLRVVVTVTPVNGTGHMLSFMVKNPT